MARFAKPRGGLQIGKGLLRPPKLRHVDAGAPCGILFITDLHLRPGGECMVDYTLNACRDVKPDIVLLGGDMAEYDEGLELFLSRLRERFPASHILAVPGNNDDAVMDGDRDAQMRVYQKYGAHYLLNALYTTQISGRQIEIAGLEDAYKHEPKPDLFTCGEGAYRILLAHEPIKQNINRDADLLLFGHTHGGQINVLGATCYLLHYENMFVFEHIADTKRVGKSLLLVSRGIGYSKLPIRLGAAGEIHYIR